MYLFSFLSLFWIKKRAISFHLMCGLWAMLDSEKSKRRGERMGIWKFSCFQHLQIDSVQCMIWINHSMNRLKVLCAGRQREGEKGGGGDNANIDWIRRSMSNRLNSRTVQGFCNCWFHLQCSFSSANELTNEWNGRIATTPTESLLNRLACSLS